MSSYRDVFSGNIEISLKNAVKIVSSSPESASAMFSVLKGQKRARKIRETYARNGIEVPPLLIASTTETCNLTCAGCYACANSNKRCSDLPDERIFEILSEAAELGVGTVLLAGGEPLLSHGWLDALGAHTEMAGIVFTNGTMLDQHYIDWFSAHRHIVPTISIEGDEASTDERRGKGVFAAVQECMKQLRQEAIPFGVSVTVTEQNIDKILCDTFVAENIQKGCRLFVFVEYVPVEADTEMLTLSKDNKTRLDQCAKEFTHKYPALFIPFPGDEEKYGGCLAAGRGFVHVSSDGNIEPCPFAPFSDTNLRNTPLIEALQSRLLSEVRSNHHLLKEGNGGCALWHNREWMAALNSTVEPAQR